MSFLPKGYQAPAGTTDYMKLEEGSNRLRILSDEATIGWEGWKDGKPFRREGIEKNIEDDEVDTDSKYGKAKPKINHFWAFLVWDYATKQIKILEITQKTVMKALEKLADDSDWGNPTAYDLNIEREKNGERTTYSVTSYPPKKITPDVAAAFKDTELDPKDLFDEFDAYPTKGKKK